MLPSRPQRLVFTLVLYITLALSLASVIEARVDDNVLRRDHVVLNRLVKKRAHPLPDLGGGTATTTTTTQTTQTTPVVPPSTKPTPTAATTPTPATSDPSSSSSSVVESPATSSALSTASVSSLSLDTPTATITTPPVFTGVLPTATVDSGNTPVIFTSTTVETPDPTATSDSSNNGSMSKTGKTVITILIVIAASVAGIVILWTIIRKWKLSKSDSFEDRMQPIDWQPTPDGSAGPPFDRRVSTASSFHTDPNMDAQHNVGAYGTGAEYEGPDYPPGAPPLQPVPDHDFTAGTAQYHHAPVGGYADLARGPSPPQMQEAYGQGMVGYGGGYAASDPYEYDNYNHAGAHTQRF